MPVLTNPRYEKFAQYLAQGKTATDAYELTGYKPSRFNASKLANNPDVKERVIQITTKKGVVVAKATQITVETLIEQANEICRSATQAHQYSAAIGAIREIGVLSGVRVERKEVGQPGEFDHLSDEALLADLRERFARLDSETRLAISNGSPSSASITFNGGRSDNE